MVKVTTQDLENHLEDIGAKLRTLSPPAGVPDALSTKDMQWFERERQSKSVCKSVTPRSLPGPPTSLNTIRPPVPAWVPDNVRKGTCFCFVGYIVLEYWAFRPSGWLWRAFARSTIGFALGVRKLPFDVSSIHVIAGFLISIKLLKVRSNFVKVDTPVTLHSFLEHQTPMPR